MRIGIDVDDVLSDYLDALIDFHNGQYRTNLAKDDFYSFAFQDVWGCSREQAIERVHRFYDSSQYLSMKPMPGAQQAMQLLSDRHELFIITGRTDYLVEKTHRWLDEHFAGVFDEVHFTNFNSKTSASIKKSEVCRKLGIDVLVEDAPHNVTDCAQAGVPVLLYEAPWNKNMEPGPGITPVESWPEATRILESRGWSAPMLEPMVV